MFENHLNRKKYFEEQYTNTQKYIIPFIETELPLNATTSILEIGCGEGGNLRAFIDIGCKVVGVDMATNKIENGKQFFSNYINQKNVTFIAGNIYEVGKALQKFDLIILKDTLEHIHNQEQLMGFLKTLLNPTGKIFLAFPPWQMPFGGHQQMCENKWLAKMPFYHLLPEKIYAKILQLGGESEQKIIDLLEIKQTAISIEQFEKILKTENYTKDKVIYYFINPNYEIKFGIKPKIQNKFISKIPYLRNFLITTCYYLLSHKN